MNKDYTIAALLLVLAIVLGYFVLVDRKPVTITENPLAQGTSTGINIPPVTQAENPGSPITIKKPGSPVVETGTSVNASQSTAAVTGRIVANGVATSYWYEYGLSTSVTSRTVKQTGGSSYNQIIAPGYITGLAQNTRYYYRLVAENAYGVTRGATYGFTTDMTPPPAASLPTAETLAAVNVERTTVNLNGKVNPKGFNTSYWFEYGETSSLGSITNYGSVGNGQTVVSVGLSLAGLKPQTKYYYRMMAQNPFGTAIGSVMNFTTDGPAASSRPTIQTNAASNVSTSTATLNGRVNPNGSDTVYWFEYSKVSLSGDVAGTLTSEKTMLGSEAAIGIKADLTGLERNTRYYYRLLARNSNGTVVGSVVSFRTVK